MHAFQLRQFSDSLINALLPSNHTTREELQLWQCREFRLSPKDHWEVNGILGYLEEWNALPYASILAVFGPTRERDTWVTEFILDTIQAFQVQGELVAFVMCDRPNNEYYTALDIIKIIICQILELRPTLILEEPEIFNLRDFHRASEFMEACSLLKRIVARLDRIVILIDRIDRCQPDSSDSTEEVINLMLQLLQIHGNSMRIIITSADSTPKASHPNLPISFCQISTQNMPFAINHRRPKRHIYLQFIDNENCYRQLYLYFGRETLNAVFHQHEAYIEFMLVLSGASCYTLDTRSRVTSPIPIFKGSIQKGGKKNLVEDICALHQDWPVFGYDNL